MVTKEKDGKLNLLSSVLSVFIIAIFFLVGPAQALDTVFSSPDTDVREGDIFEFSIDVDMNGDYREMPQIVQLIIYDGDGFESTCEFNVTGNILSCDNSYKSIMVYVDGSQCNNLDCAFGYGYGYNQFGSLKFTIQWETPNVDDDKEFNVQSVLHTEGNKYEKEGLSFLVEDYKRSRSLNAPLVGVEKNDERINETQVNETQTNQTDVSESSGTGLFANLEITGDEATLSPADLTNPTPITQEVEEEVDYAFGALVNAGFPMIVAFFIILAIFGFILFTGVRAKV